MKPSPDMKRSRPNAKKLADISVYKNSKLIQNKKRGGSSLATYQGREAMKSYSIKGF
jgi:hypothetical protein